MSIAVNQRRKLDMKKQLFEKNSDKSEFSHAILSVASSSICPSRVILSNHLQHLLLTSS